MASKTIKEYPILFSGPMVRAILDGTKTQTRRVVKLDADNSYDVVRPWGIQRYPHSAESIMRDVPCPYGKPGDRLWVRETWSEVAHTSPVTMEPVLCEGDKLIEHAEKSEDGNWYYGGRVICYRATSPIEFCDGNGFSDGDKDDTPRWKSPMFMPRWASRITLEITGVRVERVQEISEADAIAEGAPILDPACTGKNFPYGYPPHAFIGKGSLRDAQSIYRHGFSVLWDSIAKPGHTWEDNPWVWAVTFKRLEAGNA